MECLLCKMWSRMPYAKRPTTPTSTQETEGALIVGYWIATRQRSVARICEKHMNILTLLDQQDERRIEGERAAEEAALKAAEPKLPEHLQLQVTQLEERKQAVVTSVNTAPHQGTPQPITVPVVTLDVPVPLPAPVPVATGGFQLGPGPLTNENVITAPPPLPVPVDTVAPYRAQINGIAPPPTSTPVTTEPPKETKAKKAKVGTREGALEAALEPPTEGAKVTYPCPSCGKEVTTGDVHACDA